jgi:hypothetical protein
MPAEKTRQDGWPRYYAFSESGYINQQIWGTVMLLFCERFNLLHPGMNAVLFSDQLASHLNPVVVGMAYQQHVHMWSLVANSSHFLQPLDDLPFGAFKKYTAAIHNDRSFKAKLLGESGANLLLEAAYEAEVLAFTKPIITGGFARTGLFPFDRDVLWHRFTLNTGKFLSTSRADEMRAAASAVISQAHENTKRSKMGLKLP